MSNKTEISRDLAPGLLISRPNLFAALYCLVILWADRTGSMITVENLKNSVGHTRKRHLAPCFIYQPNDHILLRPIPYSLGANFGHLVLIHLYLQYQ